MIIVTMITNEGRIQCSIIVQQKICDTMSVLKEARQVYWVTSVIMEHLSVWAWDHPGMHSEFKVTLDYIARLLSKILLKWKLFSWFLSQSFKHQRTKIKGKVLLKCYNFYEQFCKIFYMFYWDISNQGP